MSPTRGASGSDGSGPARTRKRSLSREQIITAAITLTDDKGVEGLTMRNLGAALGVDPMTIYGYFEDKAALVDAVVDSEARRIRESLGTFPADPVEAFVHLACYYRTHLLEHPNLAPLVSMRAVPSDVWTTTVATRIAMVQALGVADHDVPLVANALSRFVVGYVVQEAIASRERMEWGEDEETHHRSLLTRAELVPEVTDVAVAMMRARIDPEATDREFEEGIRALIRGLAAGLGRQPAPTDAVDITTWEQGVAGAPRPAGATTPG